TARSFSMGGRLLCIGVATASTRLSYWEVTLSRTSVSWHTISPMERSDGGRAACRRVGRARLSLVTAWCFWLRRTLFWRQRLKNGTLNEPLSSTRTTRLASWLFALAARVKLTRRILPGRSGRACQVFPHPCTTRDDSILSRTAVSFSVELQRQASWF